jgi:hypothetical protein
LATMHEVAGLSAPAGNNSTGRRVGWGIVVACSIMCLVGYPLACATYSHSNAGFTFGVLLAIPGTFIGLVAASILTVMYGKPEETT